MSNINNIIVAGDPHGRFTQITDAIKKHGSKYVILLGDMEASKPLDELIPPSLGADVWYIKGNHEHEDKEMWDNVINSRYGSNDLSGIVVDMDGILVSGLSGVFESEIWRPPSSENFNSIDEWIYANKHDQWFDDKKFRHQAGTIFPNDYYRMAEMKTDVLVSHEAPDCHPYGYTEINDLATYMGAKHVFHGHHHDNIDYSEDEKRMGFKAHGVGLAGIKNIYGVEITPGLFDEQRNKIRSQKIRI